MDNSKIRIPQFAGQFYPADEKGLKKQIASFIEEKVVKIDALGCLLPHAGYIYSGKVATQTLASINLKQKIILIGPNHTGIGSAFSIMTEGTWQTPLGDVKIDSVLAGQILKNSRYLEDDILAHTSEHSLEVELPLLKYFKNDFEIVPITVSSDNLTALKDIGKKITQAIKKLNLQNNTLIIASSDMTHYEPQEQAQKKDMQAIEAMLELDEDKLAERVDKLDITMCGYAPAIIMINAAKHLGAKRTKLIKYETSAEATQDKTSVVGYAGLIIY